LWALNEQGHLSRRFEAKNFQAAMDFLNLAGAVAEAHGHHPDLKLTRYRQVEVSVYTQKLDGLTAADFELAGALDKLPVVYSAAWKTTHPGRNSFIAAALYSMSNNDLFLYCAIDWWVSAAAQQAEANAEAHRQQQQQHRSDESKETTVAVIREARGAAPPLKAEDVGRSSSPRQHHRDTDAVSVNSQSSSRSSSRRNSPIHSSRYSDDGTLLHQHDFVVHTGHEIPLGHSDSPHREIHAPGTPEGRMRYETETEHAALQAHPELPVDRRQAGHPVEGQLPLPQAMKPASSGRRRPPPTPETWGHMAHALRVLRDSGYDATESDIYLPMVESQYIYPDVEESFDRFYHHILKRLTPAWRADEPKEVVSAALEFAEAYECVRDIVV
jgi:pterin-4a-carbinolamine dehydratase